jgi:uncharacterized membrane protein (TIGR02234 family)
VSGRRGLLTAISLLAVGGALLLVSGGRAWSTTTTRSPGFPEVVVSTTGAAVAPLVVATGVLALAAAAALVALRGWGRRILGVLVAMAGAATLIQVVTASTPSASGAGPAGDMVLDGSLWRPLAAAAAALVTGAGALIAVRGGRWPAMGAKYERDRGAASARPADPDDTWAALDRGEDPTA